MKVNTSLCMGIANQREDDDMMIFIPPSLHVGHHKNLPTSEGSSMTRLLVLLFPAPTG
jgi:hypothetical protein